MPIPRKNSDCSEFSVPEAIFEILRVKLIFMDYFNGVHLGAWNE